MNYDDYIASRRAQYDAFAKAIRRIIERVLDAHPEIPRAQQIQARAKTADSLARKLRERGLSDSQTIESDLKDLAGVRLIFYTNADVDHFLGSRVIQENFKVDYDASNFNTTHRQSVGVFWWGKKIQIDKSLISLVGPAGLEPATRPL